MIGPAPKPSNETARLAKLASYGILDSGAEEAFDRITRLAARLFHVPTALISLIDEDRQWFKSRYGFDAEETPRGEAFGAHTILRDEVMVVPDATKDPRFTRHPLVRGRPHIRFYAGAPLMTQDGLNLGSLCVMDRTPREMSTEDREALLDLACIVVQAFELRKLAAIDPVTELPNRRTFEDLLGRERKRALRAGRPLGLIVVGLDRLANLVEEFGVETGNQVLQSVTQLLRSQLRDSDLIVRYGPQEFAILLPETDAHGVDLVAEHLRTELEFASFMTEKGDISVTARIGASQFEGADGSVEEAVARAVKAAISGTDEGAGRSADPSSRLEAG
jgi:diguanylate cyclase (GGDEF)-like protein